MTNKHQCPQDPSHRFKGDVMDLRLDIERRKRFAGKDRDYKREGGRSPGGSRGPSRERSSEKSGKHHKKSKYVPLLSEHQWLPFLESMTSEMNFMCSVSHRLYVVSSQEG